MTVADRIRERRLNMGLSQDDLARRMGYRDKTSISKIENSGNDISMKKIAKIAEALDVTPAFLMGWNSESSLNDYTQSVTTLELIKALCKVVNISLFDLERQIDITPGTLSRMPRIPLVYITRIAKYFDKPPEYFMVKNENDEVEKVKLIQLIEGDDYQGSSSTQIERALEFYSKYEQAPKSVQETIDMILKSAQQKP